MTITPLAPRRPYTAVSAGSLSTSIDAISCGLIPVRLPPGPGWIATPSSTYSGSLLPRIDVVPRMRTATPPSALRVTITPGKRPISTCSMGWPGWRSRSSAVTIGLGDGLAGAVPLRWPQPAAHAIRSPSPTRAGSEDEVVRVLRGLEVCTARNQLHATYQYTASRVRRLQLITGESPYT